MTIIDRFGPAVHAAVAIVAVPKELDAHFKLLEPASWFVENERGDPQKSAPCGTDPKAEMSAAVTKVTGGSTLHLKVLERSITRGTTGWRSPSTRVKSCRPIR